MLPAGENVRKAVKWISDHLKEDNPRPLNELINTATQQFNLSPKESEELYHFYRNARDDSGSGSSG